MADTTNTPSISGVKKITREQALEMGLVPFGKAHPIRQMIQSMEVGELLHISKADFNWHKHTPNFFCNQIKKRSKKRFKMWKKQDLSGWVVERTA